MKQLMSSDRSEEQLEGRRVYRKRKADFFVYYQSTLAVIAVFVFYTFFDVYFWENFKIIPPVVFINLYIAAIVILFILAKFSRIRYRIPFELVVWCVGYSIVSSFSFLLLLSLPSYAAEVGFQQLRTRFLSECFLLLMFVIFSKHTKVQTLTRISLCVVVLIACVNNVLELLDPSIFGGLNTSGRPAGFYMNPNITGCALILGMIFGMGALPQKIRVLFAMLVLIGVFTTFSRGSILGWFVVMGIFYYTKLVSRRQIVLWAIGIVGVSVIFGSILSGLFDLDELQRSGAITANFDNIRERLEWFQNPKSEDSADSRLEVVAIAWQMFGDHPLLGNGLASTDNLNNWGISTHNMYLLSVADHGILGIFILPTLVYVVTRNAQGESKSIAWAFGAFILLWGCFSHNILEERYILMSFSLMAAMNRSSRFKRKIKSLQPGY
jgi:hypothetical protein